MKKLFIYGVTALAMLTGCNDLLDKSPLDTFTNTPAYWSNTDNLDNQCNTFYQLYRLWQRSQWRMVLLQNNKR